MDKNINSKKNISLLKVLLIFTLMYLGSYSLQIQAKENLKKSASGNIKRPNYFGTKESVKRGEDLYYTYCTACHGPEGHGDGPYKKVLPVHPTDLTSIMGPSKYKPEDVFKILSTARKKNSPMPDFTNLSKKDRWDLVSFIFHLNEKSQKKQDKNLVKLKGNIKGAFGIKFGDKLDRFKVINKVKTSDGKALYIVKPYKEVKILNNYAIMITPKSKRVYSIWGISDDMDLRECKRKLNIVARILQDKYKIKPINSLFSFGQDYVFETPYVKIYLNCNESGYSFYYNLYIRYYNKELEGLYYDEKIEIRMEKREKERRKERELMKNIRKDAF